MARVHPIMKLGCDLLLLAALSGCVDSPAPSRVEASTGVSPLVSASGAPKASGAAVAHHVPSVADAAPPVCSNEDPTRRIAAKDGTFTVFVSTDPSRKVSIGVEQVDHEDICIARNGGAPRILVAAHGYTADEQLRDVLALFGSFVLSADEELLFFTARVLVHGDAAHVVSLVTGKETFLFDGAVEGAIVKGRDKGHYLASHLRLDTEHPVSSKKYRGRMTTFDIVSKEGKTIRKLGEAEARKIAETEAGGVKLIAPEDRR